MFSCRAAFLCLFLLIGIASGDYWSEREKLLKAEESMTMGASIDLNYKELLVNDFLMEMKRSEFDDGFEDPASFIPARHLFDTLESIEDSKVFQFLKQLPKGSLLHGHDLALVSPDYLYNLTFSDNLYVCIHDDDTIRLRFLRNATADGDCVWQLVEALRRDQPGFDEFLKAQLTLIRKNHRDIYTDINVVWSHFQNLFSTVNLLICYEPIFKAYFHQVLQELYEDNVLYIEFRTTLPPVYDLDGNEYGPLEVAAMYKEVTDEFTRQNPDFLGAKLIYAPVRNVDDDTFEEYMEIVKGLKVNFPEIFAGFDLVGQEDLGKPLVNFIDQLHEIKNITNLFFHAGETNWFGSSTDENLIDAVLLGTLRIGHGYAVLKRPQVLRIVKENDIAIEICPISNQVLLLNEDMRNHPGNYLFANDFPVVISNDDPSFWGTRALSYDWYMAFMGMTSRETDLRFLKQLAINSIQYSVYDDKNFALDMWQAKWDKFIDFYAKKIIVMKNLNRILVVGNQ